MLTIIVLVHLHLVRIFQAVHKIRAFGALKTPTRRGSPIFKHHVPVTWRTSTVATNTDASHRLRPRAVRSGTFGAVSHFRHRLERRTVETLRTENETTLVSVAKQQLKTINRAKFVLVHLNLSVLWQIKCLVARVAIQSLWPLYDVLQITTTSTATGEWFPGFG